MLIWPTQYLYIAWQAASPLFFSGPGNQYSDLWLGWASHHTEQRKRAGHGNWLWNETEKSPAPDRWLNNTIAQAQVPGTPIQVHAYSRKTLRECFSCRVSWINFFPVSLLTCSALTVCRTNSMCYFHLAWGTSLFLENDQNNELLGTIF